jgi:hypothetical protein
MGEASFLLPSCIPPRKRQSLPHVELLRILVERLWCAGSAGSAGLEAEATLYVVAVAVPCAVRCFVRVAARLCRWTRGMQSPTQWQHCPDCTPS